MQHGIIKRQELQFGLTPLALVEWRLFRIIRYDLHLSIDLLLQRCTQPVLGGVYGKLKRAVGVVHPR